MTYLLCRQKYNALRRWKMKQGKTYESRTADLEDQIMKLQERKKRLIQRQKEEERKARTHRLISCGAVLESSFGMEIDPDVLVAYLSVKIRNDEAGNPITVADLQKQYYLQTKNRLLEENKNSEPPF